MDGTSGQDRESYSDDQDRETYTPMHEYRVTVSNTFEANNYREAAEQMVAWIAENAGQTAYLVEKLGPNNEGVVYYDAGRGW